MTNKHANLKGIERERVLLGWFPVRLSEGCEVLSWGQRHLVGARGGARVKGVDADARGGVQEAKAGKRLVDALKLEESFE